MQCVDDLEAALWREVAGPRTAEIDRAMGEARRQILAAVAVFLELVRRPASPPVRLSYPEALRVLDLQPGASLEQARRARRALALRWHPDRNPGPEAEEQMRRVNEAYSIVAAKG